VEVVFLIDWIKGFPAFGEVEKGKQLLLALEGGEKVLSYMVNEGENFKDHEGYRVKPEEIKAYAVINEPIFD
jgi:hypothetical protein